MMFQPESDQVSPAELKVRKQKKMHLLKMIIPKIILTLIWNDWCLQVPPLDLIDTGKGVKVQTTKPHLVSLGSGRLSIAITVLPLKEGKSKGQTDSSMKHLLYFPPIKLFSAILESSIGMISQNS